MRSANAGARGFTLFEMLAVIVLVGVAAGLLGIGLGKGLQGAAQRKGLEQMVQALRAARVEAIVSGQPARTRFDLGQHQVQGPRLAPAQWPEDWQVRLNTADELGAAFEFYPDGGASGGNVMIRSAQRQWRIDIAWLTGVVQLRELR